VAFCLGWAVVYANRTLLYPLIPVVKKDLGLTAVQAGWIMGIYFLMYSPMQGIGGILGDWLGAKRILVVFVALSGIGLVLVAARREPLVTPTAVTRFTASRARRSRVRAGSG